MNRSEPHLLLLLLLMPGRCGRLGGGSTSISLSSLSLYASLSEPLGMFMGLLLGLLVWGVNILCGLVMFNKRR